MTSKWICNCGTSDNCRKVEEWLFDRNYLSLSGFQEVDLKYIVKGNTMDSKAASKHKRWAHHCSSTMRDAHIGKVVRLCKWHWHYQILIDKSNVIKNAVPYYIEKNDLESTPDYIYDRADVCPMKQSTYWFVPTIFGEEKIQEMKRFLLKRESLSNSLQQRSLSLDDGLSARDRRAVTGDFAAIEETERAKVAAAAAEEKKFLASLPKEKNQLIRYILQQHHFEKQRIEDDLKEKNALRAQLNEIEERNRNMNDNFPEGLSRLTILNRDYHKKHKRLAKHLFGFHSLREYLIYMEIFWPGITMSTQKGKGELTLLERRTIVKMLFTRAFSNITLSAMWNISETRIGQILESESSAGVT